MTAYAPSTPPLTVCTLEMGYTPIKRQIAEIRSEPLADTFDAAPGSEATLSTAPVTSRCGAEASRSSGQSPEQSPETGQAASSVAAFRTEFHFTDRAGKKVSLPVSIDARSGLMMVCFRDGSRQRVDRMDRRARFSGAFEEAARIVLGNDQLCGTLRVTCVDLEDGGSGSRQALEAAIRADASGDGATRAAARRHAGPTLSLRKSR